jgi:MFS family permease
VRVDVAEADRRYEVREAARGWQRAVAIDEDTRTKIDAAYPDDRHRLGWVFRILVFGFSLVVSQSALGIVGLMFGQAGPSVAAVVFLLFGLGLAALTEVQLGSLKRRQGGTEAATAFLAVGLIIGPLLFLIYEVSKPGERVFIDTILILTALVLGVGAWRWGYSIFAVVAAICVFVLLARMPFGRLIWLVLPLVLAPALLRAADEVRLPPPHRRSCEAIALVALVFLYLAVHLGSWDWRLVERLHGFSLFDNATRPPSPMRMFCVVATALVPVLVVGWAIAIRRRSLLALGFAALLASLVTLRFYVHVTPLWIALIAGGAVTIGLALLVRRYLDAGPDHERHGFTAEPVFTDPEGGSALEVAASVASFTPAAKPVSQPGFEAGGGRSGGGGASGEF